MMQGRCGRCFASNATDLQIELSDISASLKKGSAHWEAWYSFSKTGRRCIILLMQILNLKILKSSNILIALICISGHPRRWALKGWLLGGTNFLKDKIRQQAHNSLLNSDRGIRYNDNNV